MEEMRFEDLVLAALYHDLGKIAQRAGADENLTPGMEGQLLPKQKAGWYSHKHAWYSHGAVLGLKSSLPPGLNAEKIARLAAAHHNPNSPGEQLIAEGDRLSSGADRTPRELETEQKGSYIEQACLSVFSSVRIGEGTNPPETFHELGPLAPECANPKPSFRNSRQIYAEVWKRLSSDLSAIRSNDFSSYLSKVDTVLERWTWSVPSTTIDQPDIGLYDHVRTTVAFTTALYRYHEARGTLDDVTAIRSDASPAFALVSGDLSGIQNYIFDLKSTKYNAKILRSRSFELRALSESVIRRLCREFRLTPFSCISGAGGRFIMVLPAHANITERVGKIRQEIELEFIERYEGSLALNLSEPVLATKHSLQQGEKGFIDLFARVTDAAFDAKHRKLQQGLAVTGQVLQRNYEELESAIGSGGSACCMCEMRAAMLDNVLCGTCNALLEAGTRLPKARYMAVKRGYAEQRGLPLIDGERLFLLDSADDASGFENISRIGTYEKGMAYTKLPYTVPMQGDQVKEFEKIAESAQGAQHLAMFKADLDNLGMIFNLGLGPKLSASRYASLSRSLDYFFTVMVRAIIEGDPEFSDIYTVFSGGDDLCVIGPWNSIINFSIKFHRKFEEFTGGNPYLSVSGGIALVGKGLPVRRMAEEAEAELEQAKDMDKKNALSVFGIATKWDRFNALVKDGLALSQSMEEGNVSHSAVYSLLENSRKAESFMRGDIGPHNALWRSHFEYMLRRSKASEHVKTLLRKYSVDPAMMVQARIPASIALYTMRKGGSQ